MVRSRPATGPPQGVSPSGIVLTFLFLNGWHPETLTAIVPGGWSIAVEMMFYLLLPFLYKSIRNLEAALWLVLGSLLGGGLLSTVLNKAAHRLFPAEPGYVLDSFFSLWLPMQLHVFALGFVLYFVLKQQSVIGRGPENLRDLVIRNRFATTVLADRRILLGLGGFDESLPASEDRDMWIRVAPSHPVALLDRVTLAVRKHGANMSKAATRQSLAIDRVLAKAFADPALGLSSRDRRLARAVRHYQSALMRTNAGETGAALAEMATSLALVPFGGAGDDALPLVPRYRGLASLALKCLRQWRRNK